MDVLRKPQDLQDAAAKMAEQGLSIGLVPTMGPSLGASLPDTPRAAREQARRGIHLREPSAVRPRRGLQSLPREFTSDKRLCEQAYVDAVFQPAADRLYPPATPRRSTPDLGRDSGRLGPPGPLQRRRDRVLKLLNLASRAALISGRRTSSSSV